MGVRKDRGPQNGYWGLLGVVNAIGVKLAHPDD